MTTPPDQARFLGPFTPLPMVEDEEIQGRDFALVAGGPQVVNGFALEHQHHDQWCWAAVASSIARLLRDPGETQEHVAQLVQGPHYPADQPEDLQAAFQAAHVAHYNPWDGFDSSPNLFEKVIMPEVDGNRPVGVEISFPGDSHFVAVYAYRVMSPSQVYVYWQDPADLNPPGSAHGTLLAGPKTAYYPGGTWGRTYFSAKMP